MSPAQSLLSARHKLWKSIAEFRPHSCSSVMDTSLLSFQIKVSVGGVGNFNLRTMSCGPHSPAHASQRTTRFVGQIAFIANQPINSEVTWQNAKQAIS